MNPDQTRLEIDTLTGWVGLCSLPRLGGKLMSALLAAFGSPRAIYQASSEDLLKVSGIGPKLAEAIHTLDLSQIEQQIKAWQAADIQLLTWQDRAYPAPLADLLPSQRPPLLFARGQLQQDWSRVVAIVGTRTPDIQSVIFAEDLSAELARRGWLVVSGLARGVDAAAHRGALSVKGQTVAFLGSGVDLITPSQNDLLGLELMQSGALYSEILPGQAPSPQALMLRNRLIAGLAQVVIVVQADGGESGSLETARRAQQFQRHLFTVDHPSYAGNQALLRRSAQPIPPDLSDWDGFMTHLADLPPPPRQLSLFD